MEKKQVKTNHTGKMKDFTYVLRGRRHEFSTDHYELYQSCVIMRFPKDAWQLFELAKCDDIIVYRRDGYMWLQMKTASLVSVNHSYLASIWGAEQFFPRHKTVYESEEKVLVLPEALRSPEAGVKTSDSISKDLDRLAKLRSDMNEKLKRQGK